MCRREWCNLLYCALFPLTATGYSSVVSQLDPNHTHLSPSLASQSARTARSALSVSVSEFLILKSSMSCCRSGKLTNLPCLAASPPVQICPPHPFLFRCPRLPSFHLLPLSPPSLHSSPHFLSVDCPSPTCGLRISLDPQCVFMAVQESLPRPRPPANFSPGVALQRGHACCGVLWKSCW